MPQLRMHRDGRTSMAEIDIILARLRASPVHPDLGDMDAQVLAALAARTESGSGQGFRGLAIAAVMALFMGIAGSVLPGTANRTISTSPFGAPPALAPSMLLESD